MTNTKLDLDFGLFQIDLSRVIRFMKQDLTDDWFQDPLIFEDRLDKKIISDYFKNNIAENSGEYKPVNREVMNIPKGGGTLRYSLETCFFDRIAYHACGIILIEHFDKLISRRVFSHRLDECSFKKSKQRYLFLNCIEQWEKYEEFVRVDAEGKTILQTDLQNYYENIRLDYLKQTLMKCLKQINVSGTEKAKIRFCIDSIIHCLEAWSYNGINGLPQNRDISSFLANIYMLPVDSYLIEREVDYYRYMDDIRIICENKYHARSILKKLIIESRRLGLTVNSAKTSILEPTDDEHKEFLHRDSEKYARINSMISSKKKPLVAMAFEEVRNELIKLIESKKFRERGFRFFRNRITTIALCEDIVKPADFFDKITEGIIESVGEMPDVMDQFYKYLVSVNVNSALLKQLQEYLQDPDKAIYGWQNYLIWKLFAFKNFSNYELISCAKKVICEENLSSASKSGAMLYLGKCGGLDDKLMVADNFQKYKNFFTQRHALISLQEVDYEIIESKVKEYVSAESKGIYQTLKKHTKPIYVVPPAPIKYTDLIREISFYA